MTTVPEWLADVGPARAGDAAARARLADAFAPFVHAALLAQLPHHAAQPEVLALLHSAIAQLGVLADDTDFPRWLLPAVRARAARLAQALGSTHEHAAPQPAVSESRRLLSRLRGLPPTTIEKVLARLVEGVPGPELAQAYGEREGAVREELARGAAVLVQSMTGQSVDLVGDNYLWDVRGTPSGALATLETALTLLRFDAAPEAAPGVSQGFTAAELTPISAEKAAPEGKRTTGSGFRNVESTEPSGPKAEGEAPPAEPHPQSDANPFHSKIATIAATDLPAAAAVVQAPPASPPRPPRTRTADVPVQRPDQTLLDAEDDSTESRRPSPLHGLPEVVLDEEPNTAVDPPPRPLAKAGDAQPPAGRPSRRMTKASDPNEHTGVVPIAAPVSPLPNRPRAEGPDLTPVGIDPRPLQPKLFRGAVPFVVAGTLGLFAALAAWAGVGHTEKQARRGFQFTTVIVASRDIPEGTALDDTMVATRSLPSQFVGTSVVSPGNIQTLLSAKALVSLQAGDPLMYSQFSEPASAKLSKHIFRRTRGYTIPTTPDRALGGMIQPGDRVDVLVTLINPQTGQKEARTVLQNVVLLAVADVSPTTRRVSHKERKATTHVTLSLIAEEAEALTLAKELGQLTLSLRHLEDADTLEEGKTTMATLLEGQRMKKLQQKRQSIIEVVRGVDSTK